ncbi:PTS sugar transporter subunit IIA [Metabacillus schmidteae]|uniref:PTS sugar transporter subunit IIA n=1 Tax=Metabacillus schmidteae TaxID=2730405 RepID=UPI00158992BD|nr:PTS glucose transporter subunit IIA [Metabacillus schmidteae]
MLKSIFSKKEKRRTIEVFFAPLSGSLIELENVPDPVFSQKLMGEGIAIEPVEGNVVSPINGQVIQVFHTKHAIGLRSEIGIEWLIHIGLETVGLNGVGFDVQVKEGQKVKVGDPLMTFDLNLIRENAASTISPIIITNSDIVQSIEHLSAENVIKGSTQIANIHLK